MGREPIGCRSRAPSARAVEPVLARSGMMPAMTDHRPWFATYPSGVPHTLEPYPDLSVFGMLEASARTHPEATALAWFGRKISYAALLQEVERCSAALAGMGVGKGDRVALIMPNCPQYVIAFYATARLGAIVVGNNPLYTTREMEHQLRDCAPSVVVVLDLLYSDFADVFETVGHQHVVVARLNDYMPFPKKQLAPALKFKKVQREQGKPWPPVPKDAPVTWWEAMARRGRAGRRSRRDRSRDATPPGSSTRAARPGCPRARCSRIATWWRTRSQAAAFLRSVEGEEALLGVAPVLPLVRDAHDERRDPDRGQDGPDPEPARPAYGAGGDLEGEADVRARRAAPVQRAERVAARREVRPAFGEGVHLRRRAAARPRWPNGSPRSPAAPSSSRATA